MIGADRVAIIGLLWFALLTAGGDVVGKFVFNMPGTGMITGFTVALLTLIAWPWVLPQRLNDWMSDPQA